MTRSHRKEAAQLAQVLARTDARVVFAESCTGGLIAATLAEIPGISTWLCGSAVVYQIATKAEWLGVPRDILETPGPVSDVVARAMALGVLARTPQAAIAASITGHVGPNAPPEQDGLFFAAVAIRDESGTPQIANLIEHVLGDDVRPGRASLRVRRQRRAAALVMEIVRAELE